MCVAISGRIDNRHLTLEIDAEKALAFAANASGFERMMGTSSILRTWAARDPRAAADYLVKNVLDSGVDLLGDIELFSRAADLPVVAITGSNGKSTVTAMVGIGDEAECTLDNGSDPAFPPVLRYPLAGQSDRRNRRRPYSGA